MLPARRDASRPCRPAVHYDCTGTATRGWPGGGSRRQLRETAAQEAAQQEDNACLLRRSTQPAQQRSVTGRKGSPFRSGLVQRFINRMLSFVNSFSGLKHTSSSTSMALLCGSCSQPRRRRADCVCRTTAPPYAQQGHICSSLGVLVLMLDQRRSSSACNMATPVKLPLVPGLVCQSPPVRCSKPLSTWWCP